MTAPFEYPETVDYKAAYCARKTRKAAAGGFEAVVAVFFLGRRVSQANGFGPTRHAATKAADAAARVAEIDNALMLGTRY